MAGLDILRMFGVEDQTVEAMKPTVRSPVRFDKRGFMAGWTGDAVQGKLAAKFWTLAAKLPEDANGLFGRRYEVRVTDLGGKGLAQIDQKEKVVLTTRSPAAAAAKAAETGGSIWDRKYAYLVHQAGDNMPIELRQAERGRRDGGVWGWFGSGNKTEQISDNGGSTPQRGSGSSGWTWTPGQEPYPG